jgi:hypothetical protein
VVGEALVVPAGLGVAQENESLHLRGRRG